MAVISPLHRLVERLGAARQDRFTRSFLSLVAGNGVAQLFTLLASFWLARLYTPDDQGRFALWVSVIGAVAVVSTLRLEVAVMMADSEEDAQRLVWLSMAVAAAVGLAASLVVGLLPYGVHAHADGGFASFYGHDVFIGLGIFLLGIQQTLWNWLLRKGAFRWMSFSRAFNALLVGVLGIMLGAFGQTNTGLFLAFEWGLAVYALVLLGLCYLRFFPSPVGTARDYAITWRRFHLFPKSSAPQAVFDMLVVNGLVYALPVFFAPGVLGWYSRTNIILQAPLSLIGTALSQVWVREATRLHQQGQVLRPLARATLKRALLVVLPIGTVLAVGGPSLFALAFGEPWRESGRFAAILAPFFVADFLRVTLVPVVQLLGKQALLLRFSWLSLLLIAASVFLGHTFFHSARWAFALFSATMCMYDVFVLLWLFRLLARSDALISLFPTPQS
jgi:teichuronic acid exporter